MNRLAQTKAIVEQVEREITHRAAEKRRAAEQRPAPELTLLSPMKTQRSLPARAARRVMLSLFAAAL